MKFLIKNIIIYVALFIFIGELMIRFDESFTILEDNRIVKIATSIKETPEYKLLKDDSFTFDKNDLKVMVVGDSYIHGGGVEFKNNFSQQLKRLLITEKFDYGNIWVLDVSKASSNNLDNNQTYFEFADRFNPDIVILGYNINDVDGNLEKLKRNLVKVKNSKNKKVAGAEAKTTIRKIYNIIYKSHFIHYVLHNLHNNLKINGITIKNSRFDLTLKSYYQDRDNWKKSKELLSDIVDHTNQKQIQLIVLKIPEVNLLEQQHLFLKADQAIETYFNNYPLVTFVNGKDILKDMSSKDCILSKYDGHPNEKAIIKLSESIFQLIKYKLKK